MKELLDIIQAWQTADQPMALATIVETTGSSYRRPGARMLIQSDGRTVGCISGGCLDQEVVQRGLDIIKTQQQTVMTYDTSSDRDIIFGAGLGCNGVINILLEFLPTKDQPGFLNLLQELIQNRRIGGAATVIKTTGDTGLKLGDRALVDNGGFSNATGVLEKYAQFVLAGCRPEVIDHPFPGGSARIFVETIQPQRRLVIFGAGHDAMPLSRLAGKLGFRISVVDRRQDYLAAERFPQAAERIVAQPDEPLPDGLIDGHAVVVIMSHNYLVDQGWVKQLLPLDLPYLGLMGPRKRAERMLAELRERGCDENDWHLDSLHNPIGLDIGADTPEQIAIAVLAEIQAALAGRSGGKLREKKGPIELPPRGRHCDRVRFEDPCAVSA